MKYDVFFSLSQTPAGGRLPSESEMLRACFEQVVAADELGFDVAWFAEAHLSSAVQKRNRQPVIPHWQGEVGLMADFVQMAHSVFARTRRLEVGSAILNILCNGGPIAAAERIAMLCALHGLDAGEKRRVHVGFAGGRFEYMNRPYGIAARNAVEAAAWPVLKGEIFAEAAEIFCRLLRGDELSAAEVRPTVLTRESFRSEADWQRVQAAAGGHPARIDIERRFEFETLKIVPQAWRRELLQLLVGTHEPSTQDAVNRILPVQVLNLSITQPAEIEATHERMARTFHAEGGPWERHYLPRTTFVFLNADPRLSPEAQRAAANIEARGALSAYWTALQGTLDPKKVENAADNALVGAPGDVARQILQRFHSKDRLMLWFDFFNHDSGRVIENMEAFVRHVIPLVEGGVAA